MPGSRIRPAPFWAHAPFFHALLPLMVGIVAYDRGWLKPQPLWAYTVMSIALLLAILALRRRAMPALKAIFCGLFYLAMAGLGVWRSQIADLHNRPEWFAAQSDSNRCSLVKIVEGPAEKERVWRMLVQVVNMVDDRRVQAVCGSAFLNVYKDKSGAGLPYRQGDLLLVPARWEVQRNSGNPFEVDFAAMRRRRDLSHQLFAGPAEVALYHRPPAQPPGFLQSAHEYCNRQLRRYVTDSATYGLLQAMLLGDESSFDPELRQAYSETGVIHIVSISGSHVGVLFAAVLLLLARIRGRLGEWLRFSIGVAVIWFYVLMAGAPPSAIRAAVMFTVLAAGTIFARTPQPLNTLFAAAVGLLFVQPMWLFTVGFQLSFGAVLSMILFYRPLLAWLASFLPQQYRMVAWLSKSVAASIAAELLTGPLVIFYFHNFPLFFVVANVLAAVLVGLLALMGGMLIVLCGGVPPLASSIAWAVVQATHLFNGAIFWLQTLNPPSFRYLHLSGAGLCCLYLAIVGLAIWWLHRKKYALIFGLVSCITLLALLAIDQWTIQKQERLVVFNTSRHDAAVLLRGRYHQWLVHDSSRAVAFASTPALTGWGAWREAPPTADHCFLVNGRRVLLLDAPPADGDSAAFPVDVLVLNVSLKALNARRLQQQFHPQVAVAGGNQPRWLVQRWKDSCKACGLRFHAVTLDGAFILE